MLSYASASVCLHCKLGCLILINLWQYVRLHNRLCWCMRNYALIYKYTSRLYILLSVETMRDLARHSVSSVTDVGWECTLFTTRSFFAAGYTILKGLYLVFERYVLFWLVSATLGLASWLFLLSLFPLFVWALGKAFADHFLIFLTQSEWRNQWSPTEHDKFVDAICSDDTIKWSRSSWREVIFGI